MECGSVTWFQLGKKIFSENKPTFFFFQKQVLLETSRSFLLLCKSFHIKGIYTPSTKICLVPPYWVPGTMLNAIDSTWMRQDARPALVDVSVLVHSH